jgi:hypothetical protein
VRLTAELFNVNSEEATRTTGSAAFDKEAFSRWMIWKTSVLRFDERKEEKER